MLNPWLALPKSAPFVLNNELDMVRAHNEHKRCISKPSGKINLNLRPVPYIGNPSAPVVLLTLNPGDKPGDFEGQSNETYKALSERNLVHEAGYYYLDPNLPKCPGKEYAHRQFKEPLADLADVPADVILDGVFLAQYMPYHSNEFVDTGMKLPSQQYTFSLVSKAITRGALVIALRSSKLWCEVLPELVDYSNFYSCSNPRSPTLSRRSLPTAYDRMIDAMRANSR